MNKEITTDELVQEFKKITNTNIGLKTRTIPKMRKRNNPYFNQVIKESEIQGMIGFNYRNSVNNQLGRENKEMEFTPKKHKWANSKRKYNSNDSRIVLYNRKGTKSYLRVKVQSSKKPTYRFNGRFIAEQTLEPFLIQSKKPKSQEKLDKEIIVRNYDIENITEVKMQGDRMLVVASRVSERCEPAKHDEIVF